jgi:hypothetical protein
MPERSDTHPMSTPDDFEREAASAPVGFLREYWAFLRCSRKKWWLAPVLLILLLAGALVIASGTTAAPFIYALF